MRGTKSRVLLSILIAMSTALPAWGGAPTPSPKSKSVSAKVIAGWLERVTVPAIGQIMKAKLDTGARTSSIHATEVEEFERDGREMVRFVLGGTSTDGDPIGGVTVERELVRRTKIKDHHSPSLLRAVVELEICFNGRRYRSQFTLADRTNFHYPVLLGRRLLSKLAVVDPAKQYLTDPNCPGAKQKTR